VALAVALAASACGNYSNEDLEYMNAVPDRDALSVKIPSPLVIPNEAELSKTTHDVVAIFNGLLDVILGTVDVIRTYPPTQRLPNTRIWGPVRAERELGWQWRFVIHRDTATPELFTYELQFQRIGDASDAWINFVNGMFEAAGGARRGVGAFHIDTAMLRQAAYPFDSGGRRMKTIDVEYSTRAFPISVLVDFVQYADDTLAATNSFQYEYGAKEDGQGAMKFVISGPDLILPGGMIDVLSVTTRWLASGEGRGEATVTQGDAAVGLAQVQCWDSSFQQTYNVKPWKPEENFGGDPSVCPDIPVF
jgi:hypothetical protein